MNGIKYKSNSLQTCRKAQKSHGMQPHVLALERVLYPTMEYFSNKKTILSKDDAIALF